MGGVVRFFQIVWVSFRFGLWHVDLQQKSKSSLLDRGVFRFFYPPLRLLSYCLVARQYKNFSAPVRLRMALEYLGPIFIKMGQILSIRRELLAQSFILELAKLRDQVPPMNFRLVKQQIEKGLNRSIDQIFVNFDQTPVASASVAQVHFAELKQKSGNLVEVAVKVLRPDLMKTIDRDLKMMRLLAGLFRRFHPDGVRVRPLEIVQELASILEAEQDLMREGANAQAIATNFVHLPIFCLTVPSIYWDASCQTVLTMSRIKGVPVDQIDNLKAAGVDLSHLARQGARIFYQQVFRDGLFHADMHPGNVFVRTDIDPKGSYAVVDFGIVGSLSKRDKRYLALNFLAFFKRDYRRVAELHVQSGWVPADIDVEALASVIRAQCDPFFGRPISEISLGEILMGLFKASRRFGIEVQPQLVLLQKTQMNIEALAKMIDPHLDLWAVWTPELEKWMKEEFGLKTQWRRLKQDFPLLVEKLEDLALGQSHSLRQVDVLQKSKDKMQKSLWWYRVVVVGLLLGLAFWIGQSRAETSFSYRGRDVLRLYGFLQFATEMNQGQFKEKNPLPLETDHDKRFQIKGKGGLTLRASDRLGDIKTSILLEQRFYADSGESTSGGYGSVVNWNAQSWAAVEGKWGTLRVGRNYTVIGEATQPVDPWRCNTVAGLCGKFTAAWTGSDDFQTAGGAGAIRWNGSLTYYSPQWHGWSADVGVAPAKDDDESSRYAVRVGYEQPQWEVHGAMEWSGKNTDLGDMSGLSSTDSRSRYRQAKARLNVLSAAYHWSKDASVAFGVAKLNQMFTFREGFITKTAFDPSSMAVTLRFKARLLDWFDEVGSETGFDDESQSPRKEIKKFDDDGEFRVSYAKASAGSQQEFLSTMWAVGYTQQLTKKLNWSVALARGESTLLGVNRKSTALEVSFKQRF